ncbi:MAG: nitronate monooxygenase [Sphingobium limneticum]
MRWPDRRFLELSGARVPIVQAPMAGAGGVELAVGAIEGGAVGSLPCALLTPNQVVAQAAEVRARASGPLNLNFFCHDLGPQPDEAVWRGLLAPFHAEYGIEAMDDPPPLRRPFDAAMAEAVQAVRPEFVSFHFGLPDRELVAAARTIGAKIIGNAANFEEGMWLDAQGCDAIIAQGFEAGGHAGYFRGAHCPVGLLALLRQLDGCVAAPLIAAGGIADGGGMAAALTAGASAVQIGTGYLACPESLIVDAHRDLLGTVAETVFTNLLTGRIARGFRNRLIDTLGPINADAPPFPYAAQALAPLQVRARREFGALWAGQGARHARAVPAREVTTRLGERAAHVLGAMP